jgi:glutathione synthase/RimK-type ligase-like ATP-grasp enzyme
MAVAALGLDFGGVDVIWNERRQMAYVLEVNTACGLEGQTVNDYAEAFRAGR